MNAHRLIMWAGTIVIVVGSFLITSAALDYWGQSSRVSRAKDQGAQIISGFRSRYNGKPVDLGNWGTDITGFSVNNHLTPADMLPPGANCDGTTGSSNTCYLIGPWDNSTVQIVSAQGGYNGIGIIYSNLDEPACNHLAVGVITPNSGLLLANVSGTGFGQFPPYGNGAIPTSSEIAKACNATTVNQLQLLYKMN